MRTLHLSRNIFWEMTLHHHHLTHCKNNKAHSSDYFNNNNTSSLKHHEDWIWNYLSFCLILQILIELKKDAHLAAQPEVVVHCIGMQAVELDIKKRYLTLNNRNKSWRKPSTTPTKVANHKRAIQANYLNKMTGSFWSLTNLNSWLNNRLDNWLKRRLDNRLNNRLNSVVVQRGTGVRWCWETCFGYLHSVCL